MSLGSSAAKLVSFSKPNTKKGWPQILASRGVPKCGEDCAIYSQDDSEPVTAPTPYSDAPMPNFNPLSPSALNDDGTFGANDFDSDKLSPGVSSPGGLSYSAD
jgi:hypothetical protein